MNPLSRRCFLKRLAGIAVAGATGPLPIQTILGAQKPTVTDTTGSRAIKLFLCGDVMTGRGIDQVLPHSVPPRLQEPYVKNANAYVNLAEQHSGPIASPVDFDYIWGDALMALQRHAPAARIINLETAVTTSEDYWPGKSIHYRMHPANIPTLQAAGIDCCVLANNHVLDWGYAGLSETLQSLHAAGIRTAGAGALEQSAAPARIDLPAGRVLVFAYGHPSSGVPSEWRATADQAGVNLLLDLSANEIERITQAVQSVRQPGDIVVVSIHWGGNWGYQIPLEQQRFAHALIDNAGVDIIHGHSSHHPKGIEIHHNKLILYGCGDFLNDYEGIEGHEAYRAELTFMYLPALDINTGDLIRLDLVPLRIEHFQLQQANDEEAEWLTAMLNRESKHLITKASLTENNIISIPHRQTAE